MLKLIKIVHTIIWVIMACATFYVLYAGITKTINPLLWICVGLMSLETIVLLINKWTCPLTPMAAKYTGERQDNFDIYLPVVIAKYNKHIFGSIWAVGLVLLLINLLSRN